MIKKIVRFFKNREEKKKLRELWSRYGTITASAGTPTGRKVTAKIILLVNPLGDRKMYVDNSEWSNFKFKRDLTEDTQNDIKKWLKDIPNNTIPCADGESWEKVASPDALTYWYIYNAKEKAYNE